MGEGVAALHEHIKTLQERRDYREIIRILDPDPRVPTDPELSLALGSSLGYVMEDDRAKDVLEAARQTIFDSGDSFLIRRWQNLYAIRLIVAGNLEVGKQLLQRCLADAERTRHMRVISHATLNLGIVARFEGDAVESLQFFMRSIAASQMLGSTYAVGRAHYNAGTVLRESGRFLAAARHLALADEYYSIQGVPEERVLTEGERALIYLELGDPELSERLARSAVSRAEKVGSTILKATSFCALGTVIQRRRGPDEARPVLNAAQDLAISAGNLICKAEVFEELAVLELSAGNREAGLTYQDLAVEHYKKLSMNRHVERLIARCDSAHPLAI